MKRARVEGEGRCFKVLDENDEMLATFTDQTQAANFCLSINRLFQALYRYDVQTHYSYVVYDNLTNKPVALFTKEEQAKQFKEYLCAKGQKTKSERHDIDPDQQV